MNGIKKVIDDSIFETHIKYTSTELSKILNIKANEVNNIYGLIDFFNNNTNNWTMTPKELVTLILQNESIKNNLDEETISKLNLLINIMTSTTNKISYSYKQLAELIGIDEVTTKSIYTLYTSKNSTTKLTPQEFVKFILEHKNDRALSNSLNADTINNLSLLQKAMNGVANNQNYSSQELGDLLGINTSDLSLLYGLYSSKYINPNQTISLKELVNFILNDVVTNPEYSGNFDEETKSSLNTIRGIMNASLNNTKYTRNEIFGILSNLYHVYTKPTKRVNVSSEVWNLEINQQDMVELYFKEIGFGLKRKSNTYLTQDQRKKRPSRYDYIPFAASEIRRLKKEKVLTNNEFKLTGGICDKHDIHLNRKLVLEIKSKLPEEVWSKYDVFKNAEPDCVWTPITEITKSFNKVYDFSLNDDNYDGSEWAHSVIHNLNACFNTPQGLNHFYRMWEDAVDEDTASYLDLVSKYVRSTVKWNEVPGRDAQWGIDEKARIGEQKFRQEYECDFIGSAVTLSDFTILQKLKPSKPKQN